MTKAAYVQASDFDKDLAANGISPAKFWKLPDKDRALILNRYISAIKQKVSNRRFNPAVHKAVSEKEKVKFFRWITTLHCYKDIKA